MLGIFLYQRNDLELYISIAKCLSEMTDDDAARLSPITKVITYLYFFIIETKITVEELITVSFWLKLVLLYWLTHWLISGSPLSLSL
jgi:uncharacterized protein (DUF983 family)